MLMIETLNVTLVTYPGGFIQCLGANFADRWAGWTGARLIKVHLHSKSFGGL